MKLSHKTFFCAGLLFMCVQAYKDYAFSPNEAQRNVNSTLLLVAGGITLIGVLYET